MKNENTSKGVSTPKAEVKKPTTEDLQKQNAELLKRLAELEKQVNQKPKNLLEQINYFELKKEKIQHLRKFEEHKTTIKDCLKAVSEKVEQNDFETQQFRLSLNEYRSYGEGEKLFSITNPVILQSCLSFINKAISEKIDSLKLEIQN